MIEHEVYLKGWNDAFDGCYQVHQVEVQYERFYILGWYGSKAYQVELKYYGTEDEVERARRLT